MYTLLYPLFRATAFILSPFTYTPTIRKGFALECLRYTLFIRMGILPCTPIIHIVDILLYTFYRLTCGHTTIYTICSCRGHTTVYTLFPTPVLWLSPFPFITITTTFCSNAPCSLSTSHFRKCKKNYEKRIYKFSGISNLDYEKISLWRYILQEYDLLERQLALEKLYYRR